MTVENKQVILSKRKGLGVVYPAPTHLDDALRVEVVMVALEAVPAEGVLAGEHARVLVRLRADQAVDQGLHALLNLVAATREGKSRMDRSIISM
jgi:hypothetical protein